MRVVADFGHAANVSGLGVDLPRHDLLRSLSVRDHPHKWPCNTNGNGTPALVTHCVHFDDTRALAHHGAVLGEFALIVDSGRSSSLTHFCNCSQGMESNHGLTEVISYFIRLVINCVILIHVVPLALKWRKEKKILKQLESLASRLQLTAATPQSNYGNYSNTIPRSTKDIESEASRQENGGGEKVVGGLDNAGYLQSYPYLHHYGSQNEFDASIFGLNPSMYNGPPPSNNNGKKNMYHFKFNILNILNS